MVPVQSIIKGILLTLLVLLAANIHANDDEIVVIVPTSQFPDWQQLSFSSLVPDPWGDQQIDIKKKNNKINLLTLSNKNYFLQFPVKRLKAIDNPHLRSAFLIYATSDIKNEILFTVRLAYGQKDEQMKCTPDDELMSKYLEVYFRVKGFKKDQNVEMTFRTIDECGVSTIFD